MREPDKELMQVLASALHRAAIATPLACQSSIAEVRVCIAEGLHAAGYDQMGFWQAKHDEEVRRANS